MAGIARLSAADHADVVNDLQARVRGWFVMWSPWRQTFTAFARFSSEPLIVDEADSDRFVERLQKMERHYAGPFGAVAG